MSSRCEIGTNVGDSALTHADMANRGVIAKQIMPPILATKLYPPPPCQRLMQRSRLMTRLDECLTHKLTLISAPAGFGKTTLLSEWRTCCGRDVPLAWVSLDESESDLARFWSYVFAAFESLLPKGVEQARSLLQPSGQIDQAITALINAFVQMPELPACVLALDDFHVIHSDAVSDSLAFFIEHLPSTLHVAILSRADPDLPLARLRARGELIELHAADLRANAGEIETYFNQVMALELDEHSLDAIATHTEGWLTGMRLMGLSLQHRTPEQVKAFIAGFSGVHQHVLAYLTEEVLKRLPENIRDFLVRTSVLRRLCGPLCDALTGRDDGQSVLSQLAHDNVFTEPLDAIGEWYRYHHLLADVLQVELHEQQADLALELHARAANWLNAHGQLHEAMRHALAAGQHEWAADVIERHYRALVICGELKTVRDWIEALPDEILAHRPRIHLAHAWASVYSGRYDTIERYLHTADTALAHTPPESHSMIRGEMLALRAVIHSVQGEARDSIQAAQAAIAMVPEGDMQSRLIAHQALGNGKRLLGLPIEAEAAYRAVLSLSDATNTVMAQIAARLRLGQALAMQGRLREAADYFEQSMRMACDYGSETQQLAGESYIRLGDVLREWNRLSDAQQLVLQGIALAERANNASALLSGYFALMRLRVAQGQSSEARQALHLARQLATHYDFPYLDERLSAHEAWLNWVESDFARLAGWADHYRATHTAGGQDSDAETDLQDTLLVRSHLQQAHLCDAECVLEQIQQSAQACGRGWTVIQTHVLAALLANQRHQRRQALASLGQALALAEPEGFVRLFLDEGASLQSLLADVGIGAASPAVASYADRLLHLLRAPNGSVQLGARLTEPLSARELEVLQLMAAGASNQDIADKLVIAQGTVKAHIHHIFGKLGAANRILAISRARAFGLVEHE